MTDTSASTVSTPRIKTVRTTFKGVMISLPEEGVVSGGPPMIRLSPRLQDFIEYDWARREIPELTEENKESIRAALISELMKDYGLDKNLAAIWAKSRLWWNRP